MMIKRQKLQMSQTQVGNQAADEIKNKSKIMHRELGGGK